LSDNEKKHELREAFTRRAQPIQAYQGDMASTVHSIHPNTTPQNMLSHTTDDYDHGIAPYLGNSIESLNTGNASATTNISALQPPNQFYGNSHNMMDDIFSSHQIQNADPGGNNFSSLGEDNLELKNYFKTCAEYFERESASATANVPSAMQPPDTGNTNFSSFQDEYSELPTFLEMYSDSLNTESVSASIPAIQHPNPALLNSQTNSLSTIPHQARYPSTLQTKDYDPWSSHPVLPLTRRATRPRRAQSDTQHLSDSTHPSILSTPHSKSVSALQTPPSTQNHISQILRHVLDTEDPTEDPSITVDRMIKTVTPLLTKQRGTIRSSTDPSHSATMYVQNAHMFQTPGSSTLTNIRSRASRDDSSWPKPSHRPKHSQTKSFPITDDLGEASSSNPSFRYLQQIDSSLSDILTEGPNYSDSSSVHDSSRPNYAQQMINTLIQDRERRQTVQPSLTKRGTLRKRQPPNPEPQATYPRLMLKELLERRNKDHPHSRSSI
jgi:hypothetical protein